MTASTDFVKLSRWGCQTKVGIPARFAQAFKMDRAGWARFYVNDQGELCLRLATQQEVTYGSQKHSPTPDQAASKPAPA